MSGPQNVEVELAGADGVIVKFPKGTKVSLRSRIPLNELLSVMEVGRAEVEGQALGDFIVLTSNGNDDDDDEMGGDHVD